MAVEPAKGGQALGGEPPVMADLITEEEFGLLLEAADKIDPSKFKV
jgi:hypothetical protein